MIKVGMLTAWENFAGKFDIGHSQNEYESAEWLIALKHGDMLPLLCCDEIGFFTVRETDCVEVGAAEKLAEMRRWRSKPLKKCP